MWGYRSGWTRQIWGEVKHGCWVRLIVVYRRMSLCLARKNSLQVSNIRVDDKARCSKGQERCSSDTNVEYVGQTKHYVCLPRNWLNVPQLGELFVFQLIEWLWDWPLFEWLASIIEYFQTDGTEGRIALRWIQIGNRLSLFSIGNKGSIIPG